METIPSLYKLIIIITHKIMENYSWMIMKHRLRKERRKLPKHVLFWYSCFLQPKLHQGKSLKIVSDFIWHSRMSLINQIIWLIQPPRLHPTTRQLIGWLTFHLKWYWCRQPSRCYSDLVSHYKWIIQLDMVHDKFSTMATKRIVFSGFAPEESYKINYFN